ALFHKQLRAKIQGRGKRHSITLEFVDYCEQERIVPVVGTRSAVPPLQGPKIRTELDEPPGRVDHVLGDLAGHDDSLDTLTAKCPDHLAELGNPDDLEAGAEGPQLLGVFILDTNASDRKSLTLRCLREEYRESPAACHESDHPGGRMRPIRPRVLTACGSPSRGARAPGCVADRPLQEGPSHAFRCPPDGSTRPPDLVGSQGHLSSWPIADQPPCAPLQKPVGSA